MDDNAAKRSLPKLGPPCTYESTADSQSAQQLDFWQKNAVGTAGENNVLSMYLKASGLGKFDCEYEVWAINESTQDLGYLTHGIMRFFGKFPPPVATRFIHEIHDPRIGPVVDPMVGSGTTLVEAILAHRSAIGFDANPFSVLLSKVKTTPVTTQIIEEALSKMQAIECSEEMLNRIIPKDRFLYHWFYQETVEALARLRLKIELVECEESVKNLLLLALGSIIRRSSRASNNLARLFLDPAKPPLGVEDVFSKQVRRIAKSTQALWQLRPQVEVTLHDSRQSFPTDDFTNLVICHPPYFNVCKYASVLKYELLWIGADYLSARIRELRDGFKIGKAELVSSYVEDMALVILNCSKILVSGGWLILMIGDTEIQGKRIQTSLMVAERAVNLGLKLRRVIFRVPKYTEASYAATQRRTAAEVGVKFADHLLVFEKV